MTVAVVSMVKNEEKFLPMALESLKNQSYRDWVLCICDDGSTDGTPDIVQGFSNDFPDRSVVVRHEESLGPDAAFNSALELALERDDVKYISRLDGDDAYLPDAIRRMRNELVEANDADMVYGNHVALKKDGDGEWVRKGVSNVPVASKITIGRLVRGRNVISGGATLATDVVYREVGGWDLDMEGGWDLKFYVDALKHGFRFKRIQDPPIYLHRLHRESEFAKSVEKVSGQSRRDRWRNQLNELGKELRRYVIEKRFGERQVLSEIPEPVKEWKNNEEARERIKRLGYF